jgi:hypothetical protein
VGEPSQRMRRGQRQWLRKGASTVSREGVGGVRRLCVCVWVGGGGGGGDNWFEGGVEIIQKIKNKKKG